MRMLKLPTNFSEDVFKLVYPATWITMSSRKSQGSASEGFLRMLAPTSLSSDHKSGLLPVVSVVGTEARGNSSFVRKCRKRRASHFPMYSVLFRLLNGKDTLGDNRDDCFQSHYSIV